ncbi:hypothetical protein [Hydrogenophaga sp. BPS33]|uniref:hypothetical protein n=1 Tax=Hydrogenophaga sp. BPS33 TaxID=2651974 RepID=UPI00131F9292|nr:hypothetical protein [Hydrogenophaga sp. BPS33]QHE83642.1 hypothetical protein F9K07_01495 [Hydrogenophaga sp. BPS33]
MTHIRKNFLRFCGLLWAATVPAWAHNPVIECRQTSVDTIVCRGGFSDGSLAPGVRIDVMDYDDKVLISAQLGQDSMLSFRKPRGPFYVLFDAGPGHVVEVDHAEIVVGKAPR